MLVGCRGHTPSCQTGPDSGKNCVTWSHGHILRCCPRRDQAHCFERPPPHWTGQDKKSLMAYLHETVSFKSLYRLCLGNKLIEEAKQAPQIYKPKRPKHYLYEVVSSFLYNVNHTEMYNYYKEE